jgi:hypothetical protein
LKKIKCCCWAHAYFEEISIFGKEELMLERKQQVARKQHAKKEGKTTCKRKNNVASRQTSLTEIGLGFFIRIVTTINL